MTVIYIDSVFFLNGLMDYLLLLAAARLAGLPLRRGRCFLAALLGGAYAAAVFLPGWGFLAQTPVKLAAGVLMGLTAYGGEEKLLRLILLFFAVSCAMAGCVLGLGLLAGGCMPVINGVFYTNVNGRVLVVAGTAAYVVLSVVFRGMAGHGVRGELLTVRVRACGRTVELTALWDSGNSVREADGRPILVTAPGALNSILPPAAARLLTPEGLRGPENLLEPLRLAAPELRPRLIPYRAVGVSQGLLLTVRTDWTEVGGVRYPGLTAALSPTTLGADCSALWGGEKGRKAHEHLTWAAKAAGPAGPVAGGRGRPLHRRQRHASPTPEPGAGGRTAGQSGRGGPAGAD